VGALNENYRWLMGSSKYVGISGGDSIPLNDALSSLSRDVELPLIVIGMASHENADENPFQEDFRALTRADAIAQFSQDHFNRAPQIYKINLGAYRSRSGPAGTSAVERRVAVLQITCWDEGADLQSGVRNALVKAGRRGGTSVNGPGYTNFDPERFIVTTVTERTGGVKPPRCAPQAVE